MKITLMAGILGRYLLEPNKIIRRWKSFTHMSLRNMSLVSVNHWVDHYLTLPRDISLKDNVTIKLDWFNEAQIGPVFRLINKVVADGTAGFSEDEFSTEDRLLWFINHSRAAVTAVESHSGSAVAFMFVSPSYVTRSVSPVMHSGYVIIDSKYQGMNLGKDIILMGTALGMKYGYVGSLGRSMLVNTPAVIGFIRTGCKIAGWIPHSLKTEQHGWTDDIIVDADYTASIPLSSVLVDDALKRITNNVGIRPNKHFENHFECLSFQDKILTAEHNAVLRAVNKTEQHKIFQILDKAAKAGDTFALDEFPTFDIFTDKFLHARSLFILEQDNDELLCVAVIGPSYLCRGHDPNLALIYLYILPSYRGKGLGKAVLSSLESLIKSRDFTGILTDTFITPTLPYGFLKAQGYTWVGTLRNSGFIQGQGISDCAIFFKDFRKVFQMQSMI